MTWTEISCVTYEHYSFFGVYALNIASRTVSFIKNNMAFLKLTRITSVENSHTKNVLFSIIALICRLVDSVSQPTFNVIFKVTLTSY